MLPAMAWANVRMAPNMLANNMMMRGYWGGSASRRGGTRRFHNNYVKQQVRRKPPPKKQTDQKQWPPTLVQYVQRCFRVLKDVANTNQHVRTKLQKELKEMIQKADEDNVLKTRDWDHYPLPDILKNMVGGNRSRNNNYTPSYNKTKRGGGRGGSSINRYDSLAAERNKRKGTWADSRNNKKPKVPSSVMEIRGAGTILVNGFYEPDGNFRGKDRYKKKDTDIWVLNANKVWYLQSQPTIAGEFKVYYKNCLFEKMNNKAVPLKGWQTMDGGSPPAPELIYRSGASLQAVKERVSKRRSVSREARNIITRWRPTIGRMLER